MDGKGCWRDNVFVERFWRSIKYEEVYLHAYETVSDARSGIADYIDFYNYERPHSSLDKQTPDEAYYQQPAFAGGIIADIIHLCLPLRCPANGSTPLAHGNTIDLTMSILRP